MLCPHPLFLRLYFSSSWKSFPALHLWLFLPGCSLTTSNATCLWWNCSLTTCGLFLGCSSYSKRHHYFHSYSGSEPGSHPGFLILSVPSHAASHRLSSSLILSVTFTPCSPSLLLPLMCRSPLMSLHHCNRSSNFSPPSHLSPLQSHMNLLKTRVCIQQLLLQTPL